MSTKSCNQIAKAWSEQAKPKILVLGDYFLSPVGSGLPRHRLGGAALASFVVEQLGGNALPIGLLGEDPAGTAIRVQLQAFGIETKELTSVPELTTPSPGREEKVIVPTPQPLGSLSDYETVLFKQVLEHLPQTEAILLLDYGHGFLTPKLLEKLSHLEIHTSLYMDQPFSRSVTYPNLEWALLSKAALELKHLDSIPTAVRNALMALNAKHILVDSVTDGLHLIWESLPTLFGCSASAED